MADEERASRDSDEADPCRRSRTGPQEGGAKRQYGYPEPGELATKPPGSSQGLLQLRIKRSADPVPLNWERDGGLA